MFFNIFFQLWWDVMISLCISMNDTQLISPISTQSVSNSHLLKALHIHSFIAVLRGVMISRHILNIFIELPTVHNLNLNDLRDVACNSHSRMWKVFDDSVLMGLRLKTDVSLSSTHFIYIHNTVIVHCRKAILLFCDAACKNTAKDFSSKGS